jgi:hypothetical protein
MALVDGCHRRRGGAAATGAAAGEESEEEEPWSDEDSEIEAKELGNKGRSMLDRAGG